MRAKLAAATPAVALFAALAGMAGMACAPAKPPTTSLHVASGAEDPPYARVTIDDQPVGGLLTVVRHGVALPPGRHRITIEAEGFLPWDREIDAGEGGGVLDLEVRLVRRPD